MAISLTLGWISVFIAIIIWGSFGAPMKLKRIIEADLNTFVFNFYLNIMVVTLPFVTLIFAPFRFSFYGMLCGLIFIPGAISFPLAIQNIGISKGQSIWAILVLLVSFFWGIAFGHKVKSVGLTVVALFFLVVGVTSMGFIKQSKGENEKKDQQESSDSELIPIGDNTIDSEYLEHSERSSRSSLQQDNKNKKSVPKFSLAGIKDGLDSDVSDHFEEMEIDSNSIGDDNSVLNRGTLHNKDKRVRKEHKPNLKLGVLGIALITIFGGSQMVPLEFASESEKGLTMPISFGFGAFLGASVIFAITCAIYYYKNRTIRDLLQLNVIHYPLASGALWTIGNIFTIIATMSPLGMSQGYSLVQLAVVVASLIGIIFFKELTGKKILYFCGSFTLAIIGAVLLGIYG
ncbi:transmembrane protein [Anaeramoeba flamelloides]|uniref:Transmembrane protein n=1 Tax=Anaeramoeba flamelloides TaxID=1746091 RepID=A0ABQ8XMX0_9EUKA|nr:transmembrane protein [Anaeramoeba flamelloides]